MNRNRIFIAIGGLIALILIGLLIYLMNSQSDLSPKQTYTVEIYHCGPLAKDATVLTNEMSAFLLSSPIPSTTGFIAPVVDLHEKLKDGDVQKISIPMSGLTGLRETFVSDYYDFNARKEEENDFIGEQGSFFSSEKYLRFSASALKSGDTSVKSVPYDEKNCITEFFIYTNQPNTNSADNKVWNSLASLKVYINGLIAANKIAAGSVIKVYYTCGPVGPPPPPPSDLDKDGVVDNDDQCPNEKGQAECSGCPCPPPPPCPGDSDSDRDGICDSEDKCPNEFGTKKYNGCKIPDTDGDGYNDEIDKCKLELGIAPYGCPAEGPKITFNYESNTGQFLVNVPNTKSFKAEFVIKEQSGKEITHSLDELNSLVFGGPEIDKQRFSSNFDKLFKSIKDPNDLKIRIIVKDLNGKIVSEYEHSNLLSIVCYSGGDCGFINLN